MKKFLSLNINRLSLIPFIALVLTIAMGPVSLLNAAEMVPDFNPKATLREVMASIVTPVSDALWNPSNGEYTDDGVLAIPDTAWPMLRNQAIALAEIGNIIQIPGRPIDTAGAISDAPDNLPPEQIQKLIESKPAQWAEFSNALGELSEKYIAAIDAKNVAAFDQLSEDMNTACSACHVVFWYPKAPQ